MKIKDTLVDYTVIPNIPVKHLSNEIEDLTQNFKNALKAHIEKPWETIKRYKGYFHDINSCFIKCVLNKEKSKSGIYVHQRNGYSIDIAIKELFGFMVSQKNMHMKYSIDKLYKLVLVEVSILSLIYGEVYDFQIRFAIIKLLTTRFSFYTQCIDDSWSIHIFYDEQDDIETVYNMVLDTDISQLPGINNELVNLKNHKHDRLTAKDIMKPRCLEDLTCLFDEGIS